MTAVKVKKMKPAKKPEIQTTMRVYPKTVAIVRRVSGFMDGTSYADVLHMLVEREGSKMLKQFAGEVSKK